MDENELVSIVMPIKNAKYPFEKAIRSALSQTFNNVQILVIDGTSENKIKDIIDKEFSSSEKITYIKAISNNKSFLRNEGIRHSKGKYISFLDPNDLLDPNYIAKMFEHLVYNFERCDLVIGGQTKKLNSRKNYKEKFYTYEQYEKKCFNNLNFDELENVYCKLYIASYIKNNHIFFDEEIKIGIDLTFNLKYLVKCKKIKTFEKKIYLYNEKARFENQEYIEDFFDHEKVYIKNLNEFLTSNNISNNIINVLYIKLGYSDLIQDITYMKSKWIRLEDKVSYIIFKPEIIDALNNYKLSSLKYNFMNGVLKTGNRIFIKLIAYLLYYLKYKMRPARKYPTVLKSSS